MLQHAFELMVLGMGSVFAFLGVLVLVMTASAAFFRRYGHLFPEAGAPGGTPPLRATADDDEILAVAIAVARDRDASRNPQGRP